MIRLIFVIGLLNILVTAKRGGSSSSSSSSSSSASGSLNQAIYSSTHVLDKILTQTASMHPRGSAPRSMDHYKMQSPLTVKRQNSTDPACSVFYPRDSRSIVEPTKHPKFQNYVSDWNWIQPDDNEIIEIPAAMGYHDFGLLYQNGVPVKTPIFGFYGKIPGPAILANQGRTFHIQWTNNLPNQHVLSDAIDPTITCHSTYLNNGTYVGELPCSSNFPRISIHVHGARIKSQDDGHPFSWYDNQNGDGFVGSYFNGNVNTYTNNQDPMSTWYHDHTMGLTRLNVYAGLTGLYVIRDPSESRLQLPSGNYELWFHVKDVNFNTDGTLLYSSDRWEGVSGIPDGSASIMPEMFGNYIVVNGKLWPKSSVEPRPYRIHLYNTCDSRFLHFKLDTTAVRVIQIGSDQGFLNNPIDINLQQDGLVLGPGERVDLIIDFSKVANKKVTLLNDAVSPYPLGDIPADPQSTGLILQFQVQGSTTGGYKRTGSILPVLPLRNKWFSTPDTNIIRKLILKIEIDEWGREIPLLGPLINGEPVPLRFHDPVTEIIPIHTTEIWDLINLSGESHTLHVHLVSFEVVSIVSINDTTMEIIPGTTIHPAQTFGPKDTVPVLPETAVRIRATFDIAGAYVWHCHLLSHEDYEMMRPFEVVIGPIADQGNIPVPFPHRDPPAGEE